MRYTTFILAAAVTLVSAQKDCQAEYKTCIAAGTAEVVCQCSLASCAGEDSARLAEFCATATANLPTKTPSSTASIITGTPGSQPSGQPPITAPAGSLALGDKCSDSAQCANGVQCWGSNAGIIRRCGNYNAACEKDSQCAYNTCRFGLCNGVLSTQTGTTAAPTSSATFACNPAHAYPTGQVCTEIGGSLTLITTTGTATYTPSSTGFACNPAHAYPTGQVCTEISGSLTLITTTPSSTGFACNPAHAYPTGQVCTEISGSLTLITTTGTAAYTPTVYATGNGTTAASTATGTGAVYPSSTLTPYTGSASLTGTMSGFAAILAGVAAYLL